MATFAYMANTEHLEKLNHDVEAWNQWRANNLQATVDLSGADLCGKDLSRADLRDANLESSNLQGTKLSPSEVFSNGNLRGANLYKANLSDAYLQDADLTGAELHEAKFRGAYLCGADLSGVKGGLRTEQLAGADLSGAKLPDQLKTLYDKLENVKGISESARKIFLAVLAGCLYCWLTIATTTDVNLVTNRASSPLPIIQTAIPIVGFYVVAPLLILCVYFYFHFYLQKLWEELGSLPAIFPDGRPLHTKVDPWLLNDLVRAHLPRLNLNRPFLSYFQLWISVLLAWWVVPITMFLFWGRYLRRHERVGTTFHVLLLVSSLVGAICLYRIAIATLRGSEGTPFTWKGSLSSRRGYLTVAFALITAILFGWVSWETRWAPPTGGIPRLMARIGYPPYADLEGAEISQRKSGWNSNDEPEYVIGAQLPGVNLRYAKADHAFLARANFLNADLTGTDLHQADLTGVDLSDAKIKSAKLFGARLSGALLSSTHLEYAHLDSSCLSDANLMGAHLNGAELHSADLKRAELQGADATNADFQGANLSNASLVFVTLQGVQLRATILDGARLYAVRGLLPEQLKDARDQDFAYYDSQMVQALDLPSAHNKELPERLNKNAELLAKQNAWQLAHDPCQTTR